MAVTSFKFCLVIFLGSLLLSLPFIASSHKRPTLTIIFTTVSMVCVTALYPIVASTYNMGPSCLYALDQIGGFRTHDLYRIFYIQGKQSSVFWSGDHSRKVSVMENPVLKSFIRSIFTDDFLVEGWCAATGFLHS